MPFAEAPLPCKLATLPTSKLISVTAASFSVCTLRLSSEDCQSSSLNACFFLQDVKAKEPTIKSAAVAKINFFVFMLFFALYEV